MKSLLVTCALTSLFLLGACGHGDGDSSAREPGRAPAALGAAPQKAFDAVNKVERRAEKKVEKKAEKKAEEPAGEAPGHANCHDDSAVDDEKIEDVPVGVAPTRGAARAPVTVVVFTDFQCPFCAKSEETMRALSEQYAGKVRIAFKHNPLPFHENAKLASRAALAAGEQGKFWEYHDLLFTHQSALGREALEGYARDLGLDLPRFRAAMDDARTARAVEADMAEAARLDVKGTPCFFVNGKRVVGAQPLEKFTAAVDEALVRR